MAQANQDHDRDSGSEWITEYPLLVAGVVYLVLSVPLYLWLEGPVGTAGTVDASVVIAGIALGSIMIVPIIKAVITNRFGAGRVRTQADAE